MDTALDEAKPIDILTTADVRRALQQLERSLTKNAEQRARYPDDPKRFLDSEVNLDETLRSLFAISTSPQLYPDLIKLGGLDFMAGLLAHDNIDIVANVIVLLNEMIEPDVLDDRIDNVKQLVETMVEKQVYAGVVDCLQKRFGTQFLTEENLAKAVYAGLSLFENAIELDAKYATILVKGTQILDYCCRLVKDVEGFDTNKAYSIELMAILLQSSTENVKNAMRLDIMNVIIDAIGPYRKDPRRAVVGEKSEPSLETRGDENEMVECLFDILCTVLLAAGSEEFLKAEGLELMIRFMKNRKVFRDAAAKVIAFACTDNKKAVLSLFQVGGIGIVFAYFLRIARSTKGKTTDEVKESLEQCLSILYELFRFADPQGIRRLFVKFWENQGEKTSRLLAIYDEYSNELATSKVRKDADEDFASATTAEHLIVQYAAVIIGRLLSEGPNEIRSAILDALQELEITLEELVDRIVEYSKRIQEGTGESLEQTRQEVIQLRKLTKSIKDDFTPGRDDNSEPT